MSYREYQEMLGIGKPLPDSVTTKDFNYNDSDNSWYGTIYVKDGAPFYMAFYIWQASQENLDRDLAEQLAEFEGTWETFDVNGGNGHYTAGLRRKDP